MPKMLSSLGLIAATCALLIAAPSVSEAQVLGTAADFGVLGGSTVTNTGSSVIQGNVGASPGNAIVGFPPGTIVPPGTIHAGDAVAGQAQVDLTTAYNSLQARPAQFDLTGQDLGGMVLGPAVYAFAASAQLTGILTLNGLGNSAAEFVFQIGSTLTTASNSAVLLINGANGSNVYWAVGSSATLGTNTAFVGNIVALNSITLNTGASITCGRALARNGSVTLDSNTITLCTASGGGGGGGVTDIALGTLGGEGLTGSQQASFGAFGMFGSAVLGQTSLWRQGQEAPQSRQPASLKDGPASGLSEAEWMHGYQPRTRRVWVSGFGGTDSLDGEISNGTSGLDTRTAGFAVGVDYQLDHSTLIGISGGYTNSTFSVAEQLTSGTIEGGLLGLYGVKRFGAFYLAGAAQYAHFANYTNRFIDWVVDENATGHYGSDAFGGQLEAGWTRTYDTRNITPFVGMNVAHLTSDGFVENSESVAGGPGILGLTVASNSVTSLTSSVGVQVDTQMVSANGRIFTPFARVAWVHEYNPDRTIDSLLTLSPAATFNVAGAPAAADVAKVDAGVKLDINNSLALFAYFDGEFSGRTQGYSGNGGFKMSW